MRLFIRTSSTTLLCALIAVPTWAKSTTNSSSSTLQATLPVTMAPAAQKPKATTVSITAGITGKSMEDKWVNSKWAGGQIGILGSRDLLSNLKATLDMSALMTVGTFSNQYGSEGSAPNSFWLNEASLAYTPISLLKLEAGVMPMQFSALPSTLDAPGFPALRQSLLWEGRSLSASIFATQAIPTAGTGAVKPSENGVTTSYTVVGANLGTSEESLAPVALNASVLRFDFRNLNSSAATDSQYLGNSIVSPGPQARFKYGFGGYEAATGAKFRLGSRWSTRISGAMIRNELAPKKTNLGYQYSAGIGYQAGDREVTLSGGYFYNESDTIPGTYASSGKGFNNRFGNTARLKFEDKKENITGFIQYVRSNEIEDRPYTADRDTLTFGLEAAYDVL